MKIKMKSIAAGPSGVFNLGKVYDLPEKQAQDFINGKYAVVYVEPAKPKTPSEIKTIDQAKAAHKVAEDAYNVAKDVLVKAKKEDKAKAAKAKAVAGKALQDAELVLRRQEEIEVSK